MIGIIPDKKYITSLAFKKPGHLIYLLGESVNDISSSEYLYSWHKVKQSPAPYFNLEKEWKVQTALKELIQQGFIVSAHDCSDGGLYITLIESAMPYHLGFSIDIDSDVREDAFLFGEAQSRVVVSVSPEKVDDFLDLIEEKLNIDYYLLGEVVKGDIIIDGKKWHKIAEVKEMYNNALAQYMNE